MEASYSTSSFTIHPRTRMGAVTLAVADFAGMRRFYQDAIGLSVLDEHAGTLTMGVDGEALVRLVHRPGGLAARRSTGLFHLAILVPSREHLGAWLRHFAETGHRLDGAGDHAVSEALYLADPEGNGIEVYRDRPREAWEYVGGRLRMGTDPVDIQGVLEAGAGVSWRGMPAGTVMGHVHLRVSDVEASTRFYEHLGLGTMAQMPGAGFYSAGGYHHHIGANTWHSRGASPPPEGSLGLIAAELILPDARALDDLLTHLGTVGIPVERGDRYVALHDPSGNRLHVRTPATQSAERTGGRV